MSDCVDDVRQWMSSNRLQLNGSNSKTEYIWSRCAPPRRRHHIPSESTRPSKSGGPDTVQPVQSARDLGVQATLSGDMTMRTHINHVYVLSSCYSALRQIRTIERSLLVHALDRHSQASYGLVRRTVHSLLDLLHRRVCRSSSLRLRQLQWRVKARTYVAW